MCYLFRQEGNMFKYLTIIIMLITVTSCGQGSGESKSSDSSNKLARLSTAQVAQNVIFNCEEDECPSSFGIVIKNSSNQIINYSSVCSGFFISKKDFITSRECMGEYIYRCSSDVVIKDINGNTSACSNITHGFVNSKGEEDLFVHIHLKEELNVEPVTFADKSFTPDDYYSRWNVEKTYKNDVYELRKTRFCRMTVNNVRFPVQQNGSQRDVVLTNCPPSTESIGSALLDSKNRVVGLVTKAIDEDNKFDHLMGSKKGRKLIYATPSACLAYQRPDLFKEVAVDDIQRLLCQRSVDVSESYYYNYLLSKIFISKSQMGSMNILLDNSNQAGLKFIRVTHPDCLKDVADTELFKACEFFPTITSDYEVYKPRISRCRENLDFSFKAKEYIGGFFEVTIENLLNNDKTQIYIESCK